jgi:CRP-like cAMP-binding protein
MEAVGHSTTYRQGDTIYRIGDLAGHMFVVLRGGVELHSDNRAVEVVQSNGTFGELAVIEAGTQRSDRAVALVDCEVISIDQHQFLALVQSTPSFALKVMRTLVTRTRARSTPPSQFRVATAS